MHKTSSASSLGVDPGGLDLSQAFFRPIHNTAPASSANRHTKITVVGAGEFGKAIAQAILTQYLVHEIAIIDASSEELRGTKFDLEHAAAFLPCTTILAFSSDYAVTSGSDLIVITAGDRKNTGESKLNLIQKNVALFKSIIPELAKHSPDAILMVVSQPVDILTYMAWKLSGFPPNRVIGSGTNMASSRFRFLLAEHLDVNAQDVQAYIVGEHGDRSFVLKSSLSVRGEPILRFMERQQIANDEKMLESIFMGMDEDTSSFRFSKHHASWAIGYSVASLAWTILRDQLTIHPVSVHTKGFHGIDGGDVFLSLPAQLGRGGVVGTIKVEMTDEDVQRLKASAETLLSLQSQLGIRGTNRPHRLTTITPAARLFSQFSFLCY